ncbi:MAG: zinc-binding alcohol dehydrogenase [Phycisphaeraceae bacterium]|nr:zinc-binding alcohol dehydrogenase [Phycisphaeraceae bacterium]
MNATALVCSQDQKFQIAPVELPQLRPQDILVRNHWSGVSIGTEFAVIRGKLNWGAFPLCTGYQSVSTVERIGEGVTRFKVGDKVYHRGGRGPLKMGNQNVSCASGGHASHSVVDSTEGTHTAAILPPGVDEAVASLFVVAAVGYNGVNMAQVQTGDRVVVFGSGLIGLGVVAAAALRGAVVTVIDLDARKLEIAGKLGARHLIDSSKENASVEVSKIAPGGADVVFESTGVPMCVDMAMGLCKTTGKFVFQGNYGAKPLSFNFLVPHSKRVTAYFPCDDGYQPCRQAVMAHLATGTLKWHEVITHRVKAAEAPALYTRINAGGDTSEILGAVIQW